MTDSIDRTTAILRNSVLGVALDPLRKEHGDVPEVEAAKVLLATMIERMWYARVYEAFRQLAPLLDDIPARVRSDRETEDLALALYGALYRRISLPMPTVEAESVRRVSRLLLTDGGRTVVGRAGDVSLPSHVGLVPEALLPLRGEQDLETLLVGRLIERREEVLREFRYWVTQPAIRTDAWFETLRNLLGAGQDGEPATPSFWIPTKALDQWAYRWYSIGAYAQAARRGQALYYVNNPPNGPDERTTTFCRWIHGRAVDMQQADGQIALLFQAAQMGSYSLLKSAWPMQTFGKGATTAEFELALDRGALPGFHWRCRTQLSTTRPA